MGEPTIVIACQQKQDAKKELTNTYHKLMYSN